MMDKCRIHSRYSYKYNLLYCLMTNYYNRMYPKNKFKGKIVVASSNTKVLMNEYERMFATIKGFEVEDIITLKKFIGRHDEALLDLFKSFEKNEVSYVKIINDIKRLYTVNRSCYYDDRVENHIYLSEYKSIVFVQIKDLLSIYDKHSVRELFIPEYISSTDMEKDEFHSLDTTLSEYIEDFIKSLHLLRKNGIEDSSMCINVFMDTDDSMELLDNAYKYVKDRID